MENFRLLAEKLLSRASLYHTMLLGAKHFPGTEPEKCDGCKDIAEAWEKLEKEKKDNNATS